MQEKRGKRGKAEKVFDSEQEKEEEMKKRWYYESSGTTWDSFFILTFYFCGSLEELLKTDEGHQSWAVKARGPTMSKKVFS